MIQNYLRICLLIIGVKDFYFIFQEKTGIYTWTVL